MVTVVDKAKKRARQAIESTYDGLCIITVFGKVTDKETNIASAQEIETVRGQPCRLSFSLSPVTSQTETTANAAQTIKLFMAPEIDVRPGSKITITQSMRTEVYEQSGAAAVYPTHQEINLSLYKERA